MNKEDQRLCIPCSEKGNEVKLDPKKGDTIFLEKETNAIFSYCARCVYDEFEYINNQVSAGLGEEMENA